DGTGSAAGHARGLRSDPSARDQSRRRPPRRRAARLPAADAAPGGHVPRRPGIKAPAAPLVGALRDSQAPIVTLVAKSHVRHVELALRTTPAENLAMIRDTIEHLRTEGQRVFLDAEH